MLVSVGLGGSDGHEEDDEDVEAQHTVLLFGGGKWNDTSFWCV